MYIYRASFRAPTTTAEEHTAIFTDCPKKKNYEETFDEDTFTAPEKLLPEMNTNGKCKQNRDGNYSYTKQVTNNSIINLKHLFANNIDFESLPADWFDLFFSMK